MSPRGHRCSGLAAALAVGLLGCGDSTSIEVDVAKGSCTASCALGQVISLFAYRGSLASACVIASGTTLMTERTASLEDLPLVEGESLSIGVVTSCVENPLCAVCWETRAISATWARHELALKNAAGCVPGDPTLALLAAQRKKCP